MILNSRRMAALKKCTDGIAFDSDRYVACMASEGEAPQTRSRTAGWQVPRHAWSCPGETDRRQFHYPLDCAACLPGTAKRPGDFRRLKMISFRQRDRYLVAVKSTYRFASILGQLRAASMQLASDFYF